jgi:DHA1 family multidrug resistance protein-like MFS transporter
MSRSWIWLLVLFTVASFVEVVFWNQVQAFTPLYLETLGIVDQGERESWTGYIAAVSAAVGIPFLPLWGALADRFARQPIIVRSFVAHLLSGVLALISPNVWVFLAARAVQSLSLGNSGLMLTTLSERAPPRRIGLAFGIINGAAPLGAFLGPLIGGPIVDEWGFPALLGIDIVLMLGVILALTFGYRDNYRGTNRGSIMSMAFASVGIITRSPRLRALFPALFLLFAGWMLAFTYVPLVIERLYTGDPSGRGTAIGLVLGAAGLVTMMVSPLLGALADRFGHWRMLFGTAAVTVLLWPLPYFAGDLGTFTVLLALINGLSSGVFSLSFNALAGSTLPETRGRVMTFAYLPVNVGYAAGPAIGSFLTPINLFLVFPVAALLTAAGILALVYASRQPISALEELPA